MKDNRGFTLIELIAAITILGIIMLVAIPNMMSVSIKSKNRMYLNDANKLVSLVKYKFESDANITKPTADHGIKIKLSDLDQTELQTGPEGKEYDVDYSYVCIKYNSTNYTYDYYVQLRENYNEGKGIPFVEYEKVIESKDKNSLIKTSSHEDGIWDEDNSDICQ